MSVVFHSRQDLGLAPPNTSRLSLRNGKIRGVTVHWVGVPQEPAHPAPFWVDLQTQAMSGNNVNHTVYGDIEYNAGACESIAHPGEGSIFAGRDNKYCGAHATSTNGVANQTTLGIAVIGDLSAGVAKALQAYIYLAFMERDTSVPFSLQGHREWVHEGGIATACPGDHVEAWVASYRAQHGFVIA
jgi:hypothetical protein